MLGINFAVQAKKISEGMLVYVAKPDKSNRLPASLQSPASLYKVHKLDSGVTYAINMIVVAGSAYFFPGLSAQVLAFPGWALGLRYIFAKDTSTGPSLSLNGFVATATRFLGSSPYSGFFLEAGTGGYFYSVTDGALSEGPKMALVGTLGVGYQFRPGNQGFSGQIQIGVKYAADPKLTLLKTNLSGFLPAFIAGLGFAF